MISPNDLGRDPSARFARKIKCTGPIPNVVYVGRFIHVYESPHFLRPVLEILPIVQGDRKCSCILVCYIKSAINLGMHEIF